MTNIEILKKFVSGEIPMEAFKEIYFSNQSLQDLLQEKLPQSMLINMIIKANNGDFNKVLHKESWDTKGGKSAIHGYIKMWLKGNAIEFTSTERYTNEFNFLISIMPDYINSSKAEALIDQIALSVPESLGKTKRLKMIKTKIKEAFHLEGCKYPRWAQDTDWPFSKTGKPMKFISQKQERGSDLIELTFEDVDTGERIIVEDLY